MAIAPRTLARIAKNTSEFTSHVVPKSRLNDTRLRVSSSKKATPRKKKWGLKRRNDVPLRTAARLTSSTAKTRMMASAAR